MEKVKLMPFLIGLRHFFNDEARTYNNELGDAERRIVADLQHVIEFYEQEKYKAYLEKTHVDMNVTMGGAFNMRLVTNK